MSFLYNSPTFGMMGGDNTLSNWASKSTLLAEPAPVAAPASSGFSVSPQAMQNIGLIAGVTGSIMSAYGAFSAARSTKQNLEYQAKMSEINARMAEGQAQSILYAAEREIGQVGLRAGKVKSSQKASQAARGIVLGEGNAAEEVATTDLMKEIDSITINANAVRAAEAARMQSVNYSNSALVGNATAQGISPMSAAGTSLMTSASTVASSWYTNTQQAKLAALLSGR